MTAASARAAAPHISQETGIGAAVVEGHADLQPRHSEGGQRYGRIYVGCTAPQATCSSRSAAVGPARRHRHCHWRSPRPCPAPRPPPSSSALPAIALLTPLALPGPSCTHKVAGEPAALDVAAAGCIRHAGCIRWHHVARSIKEVMVVGQQPSPEVLGHLLLD